MSKALIRKPAAPETQQLVPVPLSARPPAGRTEPLQSPSPEWQNVVELWLHARPRSTQETYLRVIERFRQFVNHKPISQLTLADLQAYADTLATQKPRTIERKLATCKSILGFCHKTGMIPFDVGRALRLPQIPEDLAQRILPEEDIQRMIKMEPVPRNQVLLRVLYGTGIRASEAAGLLWLNVQPRTEGEGQISVLGKGSKVRAIRISPKTWQALQSIRPVEADPGTPVFRRDDGKPMSRTYITTVVSRAARRADIPLHISAHGMRHNHATHALDKGAPLTLIQQTLGHSKLSTTSRYLHVRPEKSSSQYLDV